MNVGFLTVFWLDPSIPTRANFNTRFFDFISWTCVQQYQPWRSRIQNIPFPSPCSCPIAQSASPDKRLCPPDEANPTITSALHGHHPRASLSCRPPSVISALELSYHVPTSPKSSDANPTSSDFKNPQKGNPSPPCPPSSIIYSNPCGSFLYSNESEVKPPTHSTPPSLAYSPYLFLPIYTLIILAPTHPRPI